MVMMTVVLVLVGFASQVLAQAIKDVKEQHPDMSVTKVVVHKETELSTEAQVSAGVSHLSA